MADQRDGGRRPLQVVLGVLAAVPFASGLAGMVAGPAALPDGDSRLRPDTDGEYRFTNALWFATAPAIWAVLPRIERETAVVRGVLGAIVLGGVARLWSWRQVGRPSPVFVGAIGLELVGVPAVLAWQARVARLAGGRGGDR